MTSNPARHPVPAFDLFNVFFERIYDPTVHVVFTFSGHLDEGKLRDATMQVIAANPYLGTRFIVVDGVPVWEETQQTLWDAAFVLLDAAETDFPPAVVPDPLDVRNGPQIRVALYRKPDSDCVVVTCHHGFCDANGAFVLGKEVFAAYRGVCNDTGYVHPETGLYDRTTARLLSLYTEEEKRAAIAEEEPFIDRWRFPVVSAGRGVPKAAYRRLRGDRLSRIKAFGKRFDATVNDLLLGAFFLAFLAIRDDPADRGAPRGILTSADMRKFLPGDGDTPPANLSVAFELTLSVDEGATLEDILPTVVAFTRRRKEGGLGPGCIHFYEEIMAGGMDSVEGFFDGMIKRYQESGQKNPVFANLGVIDCDAYLPVPGRDGSSPDLRDVWFIPCVCWPYGFLVTAYTVLEEVTLMTAYEEGPYSTETVERFLEYMDGYLP
ncbi:MAG: condensation protein [Methanocalculus sp. MSAO_Arc1]|uniref:condensation protein n=1 Tax=Methanocalculus TaxID=71151 RepID=UPI000FF6ABC5|nr:MULTISPECIES: condensation protein [unclassified Methanocalculus]MCP1662521.1 NRPS condensation-like uncharacterized protein [Methanocalculus sp. AMF5]RQD79681.1 MAG: condensation protein [Methanocalculus sp. MSAO_Arc1]